MRLRIRGFVEAHLDDPTLSPTTIAQAHHISLRLLHKLFEDEPHSVAGLIRHTPAHFSWLFKHVHGLAPAEYRRANGADAASRPRA